MAIDLAALAKFDTPTICNTIELFEVRPRTAGYMDGRVRACFPEMAPAVGYAATATMRCAAAAPGRRRLRFAGRAGGAFRRTGRAAHGGIPGSGRPTGGGHLRRDHVHHLPGVRRRGTGHLGRGARCGPGAAPRVSRLQQRSDLLARLQPHRGSAPSGARRRPDRFTQAICCTPTPTAWPRFRWRSPDEVADAADGVRRRRSHRPGLPEVGFSPQSPPSPKRAAA